MRNNHAMHLTYPHPKISLHTLLFWMIFCSIMLVSCTSEPISPHTTSTPILAPELNDPEILNAIHKLASSKFFEYTQAARQLLSMGTKAVPYLHAHIDLTRESNDTVMPVCRILLTLIFQQQDMEWINLQRKSQFIELKELADQEWKRRMQNNSQK